MHSNAQIGITKLSLLAELDEAQQAEIEQTTDLENTTVRELKGRIVQCRGYCNDRGKDKPLTVLAFEKEYQAYLDEIFSKRRKTA